MINGKPAALMAAYNAINGIPCHANKKLLTEILREEWGFDGYVVSDCGGVSHIYDRHQFADSPEEAVAKAIKAGIDLECGSYGTIQHAYLKCLKNAYDQGLITEEPINRAVENVLYARFKLGMFDPDEKVPWSNLPADRVGCQEHVDLALKAAQKSIVLLKNEKINDEPVLPLTKNKNQKIAIVGNNAGVCQFGDYSGKPANPPVTPLAGIKKKVQDEVNIKHIPWQFRKDPDNYQPISEHNLRPEKNSEKQGLKGEYYSTPDFNGESENRLDKEIDFAWEDMLPDPLITADYFSIKWQGYIKPDLSGQYKLRLVTEADSPCQPPKFSIEGKDISSGETEMDLKADKFYEIEIEYYKGSDEPPVVRLEWIPPALDQEQEFSKEVKAASECDTVIAVVGLGTDYEREGKDRENLKLPSEQIKMIKKIAEVNKKVIVVLINGSQMAIPWLDKNIPAIIEAWYPGEQGGNALADIIFGDYNPSGKLTSTFYKSVDQLPPFDDYDLSKGRTYMYFEEEPIYCFGHGLSYTSFEYQEMNISTKNVSKDEKIDITARIANTGDRTGEEIVQLYIQNINSSVYQPLKQLKGFAKVNLEPGENKEVTISLKVEELAYWNEDKEGFTVDKGKYKIMIGASSIDIRLQDYIEVY